MRICKIYLFLGAPKSRIFLFEATRKRRETGEKIQSKQERSVRKFNFEVQRFFIEAVEK